jgi:hypothetical protein
MFHFKGKWAHHMLAWMSVLWQGCCIFGCPVAVVLLSWMKFCLLVPNWSSQ